MASIVSCPWCVDDEDKAILYDSESIKDHASSVHPEVVPPAPAGLPEEVVLPAPAPAPLPEEVVPVAPAPAAASPEEEPFVAGGLYGCGLCKATFDSLTSSTDHFRMIHPSSIPPPGGGWILLPDAPPGGGTPFADAPSLAAAAGTLDSSPSLAAGGGTLDSSPSFAAGGGTLDSSPSFAAGGGTLDSSPPPPPPVSSDDNEAEMLRNLFWI